MKRFSTDVILGTSSEFVIEDMRPCKKFSSNLPAPNMVILDARESGLYDGFTMVIGEKRDFVSTAERIECKYTGYIPAGRYLNERFTVIFQFE